MAVPQQMNFRESSKGGRGSFFIRKIVIFLAQNIISLSLIMLQLYSNKYKHLVTPSCEARWLMPVSVVFYDKYDFLVIENRLHASL